jgi:hypothetical protein
MTAVAGDQRIIGKSDDKYSERTNILNVMTGAIMHQRPSSAAQ